MKKAILLSSFIILTAMAASAQSSNRKTAILNHVALYVQNLQESTEFYQAIVGLDTIPEPFHDGRHTWFKIGSHSQLHLIQGATTKANIDKNNHTCFSVPSIEDFIANLKKHNVPFENWAGEKGAITRRPDGIQQIWLQDPDGHWIEINNDKY